MSDAQAMPRYRPSPRAEAAPASESVVATISTPPPSLALAVYNRCAFGPRPGDLAAFEALGADDDARLAAWVAAQLAPNDADDPDFLNRKNGNAGLGIPNPGFTTLDKTLTQLWTDHRVGNVEPQPPGRRDPPADLHPHGLQPVAAARGAGRLLDEPLQRLRLRDLHPRDAWSTGTGTSSGPTCSATSARCSRRPRRAPRCSTTSTTTPTRAPARTRTTRASSSSCRRSAPRTTWASPTR